MSKAPKRPKYCRHKLRDVAFVWWQGKQVYFKGRWGSPESLRAYDNWCREKIDEEPITPSAATATVSQLCNLYAAKPMLRYKGGEQAAFRSMIGLIAHHYGATLVQAFGPLMLQSAREEMIKLGWSRPYINHQCERLRRMFRWGVSQQIVGVETIAALETVQGLRAGETDAAETEPVQPVDWSHVEAAIAHCGPIVAAMLRVQAATGLRSANVCGMTAEQIDRGNWVWLYRPHHHKTKHRGKTLVIPLGPKAKAAIFPFLFHRDPDSPLFCPRESAELSNRLRAKRRKAKASQATGRTNQRIGEKYTPLAYARAITRACERANVPPFTPHQVRHTVATIIRSKYDIEAAQIYLGHASMNATQIYAQRDLKRALAIAEEFG